LAQAESYCRLSYCTVCEPEYRVESVTVNLRALTPAQVGDVLDLELGDQARLVFTPNGIGSAISVANRVIAVSVMMSVFWSIV
jgi:hypothetical protein